jgi:hypothetical protein
MTSQRDEFPPLVKEIVAKRANQSCSNPDCHKVTSGPHSEDLKAVNLGVAAHITSAAEGGPRYNPSLTPQERSSISNAIWLCQNCAKLVDNDTTKFPEQLLVIWKRRHEEFINEQIISGIKKEATTRAPGILNISAIHQHESSDELSCVLDIRVSNQGSSDLLINSVELKVIESIYKMPLGQAQFSAMYDLDIGKLRECSSSQECQVAQILKPGEADRFGMVLSAPTLHYFAGWRLATYFKTNFGVTQGPEIEVWLPKPKVSRSFGEVTSFMATKAEKHIRDGGTVIAESEPGKIAGYKTLFMMGFAIIEYYGPEPLIQIPGTISYSEYKLRAGQRMPKTIVFFES